MKKPLVTQFKIYFCIPRGRHYAKVMIFRDEEAMYKFYELQQQKFEKSYKFNPKKDGFLAMYQPFEIFDFRKGHKGERKPYIGNFLFFWDCLGGGVVAHECGHAALHWWHTIIKENKGKEYK